MATRKFKIPHVVCLISVGQYCFRLTHDAVYTYMYGMILFFILNLNLLWLFSPCSI